VAAHIFYWDPPGGGAAPDYPSAADVREGVSFNNGTLGTLSQITYPILITVEAQEISIELEAEEITIKVED
jgi:hypothetical protein